MTVTTPTTENPAGVIPLPAAGARLTTIVGAIASFASTWLAWTWTDEFPGNLTVTGYPGGLQLLTLVGSLLVLAFTLSGQGVRGLTWLTPGGRNSAVRLMALGVFVTTGYTVIAIAVELGGLANLEPGGWIAFVATLVTALAALGLPADVPAEETPAANAWQTFVHSLKAPAAREAKALPGWAEILTITVSFALGLFAFTYGIDAEDGPPFLGYVIFIAFLAPALGRSGLTKRLARLTSKHKNVTVTAAFVAAFAFPFTQSSDQYASLGTNILIFATVALGLNVVVGLAGLLDLGYVAFLGVGAYTAALVSGAPSSPFGVTFPFWAAVLTGAAASLVFGVVIGAPTLRLRGDYLAIVTLGFGEIFRIAMQNMDGTSGPDVTNGPNGIPSIPELELFGFNFGEPHTILGVELGRFSNYFLLMLLFTAVIVMIFRRADQSRIGRAWVAIREDETAARAMGINGFRLKLLAFALGATLAGFAGTIQSHVTYTVTPTQYKFVEAVPPNSAFLLAAVILGGMGTVSGPLIGASLLYLIPNKLQFLADYQLLLFGIALILLMRFRPEGLIADRRKQLEFKETGQLDVPKGEEPGLTKVGA
ncbi:branched-chain amino acid ABC transporter permease [Streptomyces boninensis]|uniref:branched-chain amino acid ABC transporter permease n=1 Tax=Streptomyces boninensis TaxID=2039455 RepID=UPI003B2107B0